MITMKYQCRKCGTVFTVSTRGEVKFAVCSECGAGDLEELGEISDKSESLASSKLRSQQGKIMYMACGKMQAWRTDERPVVGEVAFCAYCAKMEKIVKVV